MNRARHLLDLTKIFFSYLGKKVVLGYMPSKLWIETTSRCNLTCGLCVNKDIPSSQKKDMDFTLYKKIIDDTAGAIYDVNLFHRGEPLLHPRIVDMISYAAARKIRTRLHTNATLLDRNLSHDIIVAGLDMISFSFDGYTMKEYETIRAGADFGRTLENIKGFLRIKKELGAKKPLTLIQIIESVSIKKNDKREQQKAIFLKNFENHPPDSIVTRKPHNWGGLLDGSINPSKGRRNACTFPWYALTIFFDGKVYPCPQDFMGRMPIGDLKNELLCVVCG